jgi:hypothetical protein
MLSDFWTPLPLIIYGGLATAGGLLALLLPETLGTAGCSFNCRFFRFLQLKEKLLEILVLFFSPV